MGFNKNKGISAVAVLIAFGIFNAVAFLIPLAHTLTFWLGYGFAALASAILIACFIFLFGSDSNEQPFLRVPLVKLAWSYFIIQTIVSVLEILGIIPVYLIALIINCCISGFYIVAMLASQAAGELIEEQDNKVAEKIHFIKNMQNLLSKVKSTDTEIITKIKALSEDFKFSDPMSHSKLNDIEDEIETKILALKSETDNEKIVADIEEISDLLIERNEQCKLYKNVKEDKKPEDTKGVKYVATLLGVFALTAVIAITVLYYVIPKGIYNDGVTLYGAEKYEEAIVIFEGLNGFGDSEKMILECKTGINQESYNTAKQLFDDKKYEESLAVFEELEDFSDSKTMVENCKTAIKERDYIAAENLLNEEKYVEAIKAYTALGDFKDSKQKIEQINNRLSSEDVLYFGSYKDEPIAWTVVENKNNQMLLIAQNAICELPFNDAIKNVDWNDSSLCSWLNNTFINSFSEEQLKDIIETDIDGKKSKVFLLDNKYVKKIKNKAALKSNKDWWLRTSAKTGANAMYVTKDGTLTEKGDEMVRSKGIRPCVWIDLT